MEIANYYPDEISVIVPASTANIGPFFDRAGAALSKPLLRTTLRPIDKRGIDLFATSEASTPAGRFRGHAGALALERYMRELKIHQGVELIYGDASDGGYPTGGTGLSGAEAVGAVVCAAILFKQNPSEIDIVTKSARGEPGEHKDNVAPSTMGGIVFLSDVPESEETIITRAPYNENLGLAIGFSSHQKIGGTELTRGVLEEPVSRGVLINQVGRAVAGSMAIQRGDIQTFLKVVSGDLFHEPRRANAGLYGRFNAEEFSRLKRTLYQNFKIGLAISGAGPNMQLWYDKRLNPGGLKKEASEFTESWFYDHDINMLIRDVPINKHGAYANARQTYPKSALATRR